MKLWNKLKNIFTYILLIPFFILVFPLIIVLTLIESKKYNIKKRFRFLINRGYIIKKDKNVYYFIKDPIIIKIKQDVQYKISYDNGKKFLNIYDTEIGTLEERYKLREVIIEYQGSHPVDKQRGDVIDTAQFFISFLQKYINQ